MKLTVGKLYDIAALKCTGWTDHSSPDGSCEYGATDGYDWQSYFRDGEYLGADKHGIEPTFAAAQGGER